VNKLKLVLLILVVVVLADFCLENRAHPPLQIKLFTFALVQVPIYLLACISLALGLVVGWFAHIFRVRKKRRQANAALTQGQQGQDQPGSSLP
jgi:uncharacterized integral membrane protein